MPRDGSGVYSKPVGTTAVANTIIESAKYNSVVDDLVQDANAARPIVAGGTGATTAIAAGDAFSTKGADIASAATTDVGAATGRYVHITGTTTITGLGTKTSGVVRVLTFDGALTLTHNATSLILPGATNILTAAGDVGVFVSEGAGNWRCVSFSRASGEPIRAAQGFISGLSLVAAADTLNDITIGAGSAASDGTTPVFMQLASALTKQIDVAWAVGNNAGGLDTGVVGNNLYYLWLIQRSDTGVVDALFSLSATAPTMPTSYDRKQLIGSTLRVSGGNGPPVYINRQMLVGEVTRTLSGTSFDFTGIPSNQINSMKLNLSGLTTSGSDFVTVRLITSGGVFTGTRSFAASSGASSVIGQSSSGGFILNGVAGTYASLDGIIHFSKGDGNEWMQGANLQRNATTVDTSGGIATLPGAVTGVRITTVAGVVTFGGKATLRWSNV